MTMHQGDSVYHSQESEYKDTLSYPKLSTYLNPRETNLEFNYVALLFSSISSSESRISHCSNTRLDNRYTFHFISMHLANYATQPHKTYLSRLSIDNLKMLLAKHEYS